MREIIFRGKRTDTGEWVYGDLDQCNQDDICILDREAYLHGVNRETVGQYTGMKDKNGKRIFEGDIIQIGKKYENKKGVVNFHDHCFCVSYNAFNEFNRNNPALDIIENEYPNDVEVVGNIHDQ